MNARDELTPEQRATLAEQIGDAKPARAGLLMSFGNSVQDRRDHDHKTQREDWYCLNLAAYMGERAAPVLRRLLDAEAEIDGLRAQLTETAERSERRRIAWRTAHQRAISTGGAADRYAAHARDAQEALQHMLFAVIAGQLALHEANRERQELRARASQLEADAAGLRDKLAEEKAARNPRLSCLIVKAARDQDLYIGWSNMCEMPAGLWTREEALAYGFPRSRLDRADTNGSSDLSCGNGHWDDKGFIAEQRGWLRRDRMADYARLWLADNQTAAFDLLEPLEGETEVRR